MAGSLKLKAGAHTQTVSSGGAVASGAAAIANTVANLINSTNLDMTVTARLVAAAGAAPVEGTTVSLYLVPITDGVNPAGVDTTTPYFPSKYLAGQFVWPAAGAATSQRMDIDGILVSAMDYVPYLVNNLGQSISAGWTLDFYGTQQQYT